MAFSRFPAHAQRSECDVHVAYDSAVQRIMVWLRNFYKLAVQTRRSSKPTRLKFL